MAARNWVYGYRSWPVSPLAPFFHTCQRLALHCSKAGETPALWAVVVQDSRRPARFSMGLKVLHPHPWAFFRCCYAWLLGIFSTPNGAQWFWAIDAGEPIAHCHQHIGMFFPGLSETFLKDVAWSIGFARVFPTNGKTIYIYIYIYIL